ADARRRRRRVLHDRPRRRDRQRRDPVDPERLEDQGRDGAVGDHGLRDHVRGLPPPRRTDGRPHRAAPDLRPRADPLHGGVARLQPRELGRRPDRLPRGAGCGGRDHLARGALDRHHHLHRGRGAEQGAWDLGYARRLRVSVALLAGFALVELRTRAPLMPFRIFRLRSLAAANVVGFLLGAVIFANFFLLTLYVQQVLHWSALRTGVTFLATAGTTVI